MKVVLALLLLAPAAKVRAQESFAIVVPSGSAAPGFLQLVPGFPRPESGDASASVTAVLGICANKEEAQLVRDLARLTLEKVELRPAKAPAACPRITAPRTKLPAGFTRMKSKGEPPVVVDAPSVVWRFYDKLVTPGASSCKPYQMLVRVEAGEHVLDSKTLTGECVPKNAKSNFESKEILWDATRFPVHAGRTRPVVETTAFNREVPERTRIMLAFECGRISEARSWRGTRDQLLYQARMRPSGNPPRTWERLDMADFSSGLRCKERFQPTCIDVAQAARLVWNAKTCAYDSEPWEPKPTSAQLAPDRALFQ